MFRPGFLFVMTAVVLGVLGAATAQEQQNPTSAHARRWQPVRTIRVQPRRPKGANARGAVVPACSSPKLSYFDGPLLSNAQVVPVFWNSNVDSEVQANLPQFYADATVSSWYNVLIEYSSVGGTNQSIGPGTAVGGIVLTPSKCPASTLTRCVLSDPDIQNELVSQITAGNLPVPKSDPNGNDSTLYMIHFPANVVVSAFGLTSCVDFCAYHNTGLYNSDPLPYGVMMDEYTSACSTGCGGNSTALENTTDTASHELAESVTDTDIGLDTQSGYAYPAGWGDNNNNCGEIGDICDSGGAGDTITVSGRSWIVQEIWSNYENSCTSSTPLHPSLQLSLPATANAGTPFSFTVTAQDPAGSMGTDTAYLGTVHFSSSDGSATLPADFTFASSNQGTASFSATLQSGGSQSITATDTQNGAITGTASTTVNSSVQVTVGTSPAGLSFMVDGTTYTSAQSLSWTIGSIHTLATSSPQTPSSGTQNVFTNWSDGGVLSHSVTASSSTLGYTAFFGTQYLLTTAVAPSGSGTVSPATGYQAALSSVPLLASPAAGYAFSSWTGPVANAGNASTTVNMTGPLTVTANFNNRATTTTLASNSNPSALGKSVTFKATVSSLSSTATGNVAFLNGTTTLATRSLAGGVATYSTSALPLGSNIITAVYAGDANHDGSTSSPVDQQVLTPTSTTLTSSLNPSLVGEAVTFTATVVSTGVAPADGETVTFKQGATTIGTGILSGGSATFTTSTLTAGTKSIKAVYGGDANLEGSASEVLLQLVDPLTSTTTTLLSSASPAAYGQPILFTATVSSASGAPPDGEPVLFLQGSVVIGTGTLSSGSASTTISALAVGTKTITAVYSGDSTFAASKGTLNQIVSKASTTTTLTSSENPSNAGQSIVLTVTVIPEFGGTPTGSVTIMDGTKTLQTAPLSGGTVSIDVSTLKSGIHNLTANYKGSPNFLTSSAMLTQTVN
jgi:hypothetical protein